MVSRACSASKLALLLVKHWELHWWAFFFCYLKSVSHRCRFTYKVWPIQSVGAGSWQAAEQGSQRSLRVRLGKADVPARLLLLALPVHSPGLESWTDICLLTPFIVTGLNVCDTYSESEITANTSRGQLAVAAVAVRDVPCVWVSV